MIQRIHTKPKKVLDDKTLEVEFSLHDFPVLSTRWAELKQAGWNLYVVAQRRGVCNWIKKYITLPLWAIESPLGKGYWIYYLAHELAHTDTYREPGHGPLFMKRFKELCPIEYQHYELGYQRVGAEVAGITHEHAGKAKDIKVKSMWDILGGNDES